MHNLKHNKVLHEQVLFLTVTSAGVPYVPFGERYSLQRLSRGSWQAVASWGFKQEPNVPQLLEQIALEHPELNLEPMQTSYFLSRQTVMIQSRQPWYLGWRRRLFAFMARNASRSTRFSRSRLIVWWRWGYRWSCSNCACCSIQNNRLCSLLLGVDGFY